MRFICRKPGKKSVSILKRDEKVVSQCVTREYSFVFKRAKGCHVWDVDEKKYLDFAAGIAVANSGHSNPQVVKAVKDQADKGLHAAFADFHAEAPVTFIEKLLSCMPKKFNNVFLSNSGTEAVEGGYKCARWHTNRTWTIAFDPCFHGRTMGSLSITNAFPVQKERYSPFLPVMHAPYCYTYRYKGSESSCVNNSLDKLESIIKNKRPASVFLEPISGEPGYIVPPKEWVKGIRKLCNEYGTLLVVDEVQAGCYRTGKFLSIENFGVEPDIVCMAKAIGAGLPLGATISSKKIMDWPSGSHANTFGGNLAACAAGSASIDFMKKNKLGNNAAKIGKHIMKRLNEMKDKYEIIGDVRGIGLMIGVEIVRNKATKAYGVAERQAILCKASENGLILLPAGRSVIRLSPPLIITKQQADEGLNILENAIKEVNKTVL
ncbi:aminotransferase class III-fold pyridoxal phosphate-dependent enzyme [Candidatus Aenigmatarchaeota archaeon]